jgi:hypothetical protein
MKTEKTIIAIIIAPNKKPVIVNIIDKLESFQEIVGGYIQGFSALEFVPQQPYTIFCNEEGKITGLPGNRMVGNDIICGTFVIFGSDPYGRNKSLTQEQREFFMNRFKEIETYTQEEIDKTLDDGFSFFSFE